MKKVSEEMLTDYIFDLLETSEKRIVEKAIKNDQVLAQRYKILRTKFSQLNIIDEKDLAPQSRFSKTTLTLSVAATLLFAFIFFNKPETQSQTAKAISQKPETTNKIIENESIRSFSLTNFSLPEGETLISDVDNSALSFLVFEIPEVHIQYDNEDYELVDLNNYSTLQLPEQSSLNLINPNLILISNLQ